MKTNLPQSAVIGASGEHLVLSHLLRMNYVAGKAPDNTKDYDLIVLNKDGTSSFPIQVKTTMIKKRGWVLQEKHEKPIKNLLFCFVYMETNSNKNEIYVIDSQTVSYVVKTSHKIYLKLPGLQGQKHNDSSMRKLYRNYQNISGVNKLQNFKSYLSKSEIEFLKIYSDGWLDKYKDAWHLIGK
tara:strand:- start:1942 stop:2490 length:549 start_codon:yes stop_codon:yes gene_type:complete